MPPGRVRQVCEIAANLPVLIDALGLHPRRTAGDGADELLAHRKFEVVVADGRHALALDPTRYDVIEADAILPKTALSGLLNSQEFFQQVRTKLAPGGIYVQWAPTERTIETFRSVFPTPRWCADGHRPADPIRAAGVAGQR
jgi:spermidine synthase